MRATYIPILTIVLGCGSSSADTTPSDTPDSVASGGSAGWGGASSGTTGKGGAAADAGSTHAGGTSGAGVSSQNFGEAGVGGAHATGGATGTGGSAMSPDAGGPPHVVGNCSKLGPKGTWENISPAPPAGQHGGNTTTVIAHPYRAGTVYVDVGMDGLYRSDDCGSTWVKVNTGNNGLSFSSGAHFYLGIFAGATADKDVFYSNNFLGDFEGVLKSTNGGVDWTQHMDVSPQGAIGKTMQWNLVWVNALAIDPGDAEHVIVNFHDNCLAPYTPACVAETTDGGATWQQHNGPSDLGAWSEASQMYFVSRDSWLFATFAGGLYLTTDRAQTWKKAGPALGMGGIYRDPGGTYWGSSSLGVVTSKDMTSWTLVPSSPQGWTLTGNGANIYTAAAPGADTTISVSSTGTSGSWTQPWPSPPGTAMGAWRLDFDRDHKILYLATDKAGLWRIVVE